MYIHTYIHTYTHIYILNSEQYVYSVLHLVRAPFLYVCMYVCMCIDTFTYGVANIYILRILTICIQRHLLGANTVSICMYICMYICM